MHTFAIKDLAQAVAESFGIVGELNRVEQGLSNDNFLLRSKTSVYFIKLYNLEVSSERLRNEELVLLGLADQELIATPRLIGSVRGNLRERFGGRVLSCLTYIQGQSHFELTEPALPLNTVHEMGRALALLHSVMARITSGSVRPSVGGVVEVNSGAVAESLSMNMTPLNLLFDIVEGALRAVKELSDNGPPDVGRQWIHADYQIENILFDNANAVGVCDFEYATWDYRVVDLAMALSNLCWGINAADIQGRFLEAYQQTTRARMSPKEINLLKPLTEFFWLLNLAWGISKLKCNPELDRVRNYIKQTQEVVVRHYPNAKFDLNLFKD